MKETYEQAAARILKKLETGPQEDPLESRALAAVIKGDRKTIDHLMNVLDRRNSLNLHFVRGGREAPPQSSEAGN